MSWTREDTIRGLIALQQKAWTNDGEYRLSAESELHLGKQYIKTFTELADCNHNGAEAAQESTGNKIYIDLEATEVGIEAAKPGCPACE